MKSKEKEKKRKKVWLPKITTDEVRLTEVRAGDWHEGIAEGMRLVFSGIFLTDGELL